MRRDEWLGNSKGTKVIVMVANNSGWDAGVLFGRFPQHVGHLYSPPCGRRPNFMPPYALDNGRYASHVSGKPWNESDFLRLLDSHGDGARWIVVPDCVGDRDGTLRLWDAWAPRLEGYTLAMAVQDGMTEADVPAEAAVVFVGGTTSWKRRMLYHWPQKFPRVHVGRINTEKWLWRCADAGVESCDGTGWFRGDKKQFNGLQRFLERHSAGRPESRQRNFLAANCSVGDSVSASRTGVLSVDQLGHYQRDNDAGDSKSVAEDRRGAA